MPGRLLNVIKALQQLENSGLASATGTHQGHGFPGRQGEREILQCGLVRPRWVAKLHRSKLYRQPLARGRQWHGGGGFCHRGFTGQQFHQALGRACGAQQVAIHLAQHGYRASQQHHVHHRLPQVPRGHFARQHGLRAPVQAPQQQGGVGDDDESHQHGACAGALHGGGKRTFGCRGKARGFALLGRVALHHRNGVEHLGRDGTGVGHAVLAVAREPPHAPADPHGGQHHQQHGQQHHRHDIGVGPHQHAQGADAHHGIAQPHRQRRAHHGLHESGVCGQP